eukprot:scaffold3222_cov116-Isochrysis_galbana.AAC.5
MASGGCDGEVRAVWGKVEGRQGGAVPRKLTDTLLLRTVPHVDDSVTAACRKRTPRRMIANGVDWEGGVDACMPRRSRERHKTGESWKQRQACANREVARAAQQAAIAIARAECLACPPPTAVRWHLNA